MSNEPHKNYEQLIAELRESMAWMDLVLSNINEGILAVGNDLKVRYANDAIEKMLGRSRITMLGTPIWENLVLCIGETVFGEKSFQKAFMQNDMDSLTGRYTLHREDEKELTVDVATSLITKVSQTVFIIRDVTRQLENERALIKEQIARTQEQVKRQKTEENKRLLQSIIDGSETLIFLKDSAGKYMMANTRFKKVFGLNSDQIIGRTDEELFPDEIASILLRNDQQVLQTGHNMKWEEEIHFERRRRAYITVKFPLLNAAGESHSLCGILTDITARKELEERKDTFINMASHELKTPLTSMKLFWEFTQKHLARGETDKSLYSLEKINKQLDRMTKLADNLLNISRIETGKFKLEKEEFDLFTVIADAVETIQATTKKHNIRLGNGSKQYPVWGDKDRMNQVLLNLLSNAVKYSPRGGDIIVRLRKNKGWITISVRDFGIGILKEDQKKIFNRFYKVIDGPQSEFPGLGIGLYIASEIIRQHGGTISVNSNPGEGSTFLVRLPLR